ncbi:hypothetical protein CKAH01_06121 [Colletotrichum kahawae]|uniref:Uncharacterized protein n=1 Tax=Colletotrichum kahawae TaxID=34407 RepID=A0AAD9YBV2_COLKA|nr:hypothetical protein CKAH01_06121 [Colletotrichum kahawae]
MATGDTAMNISRPTPQKGTGGDPRCHTDSGYSSGNSSPDVKEAKSILPPRLSDQSPIKLNWQTWMRFKKDPDQEIVERFDFVINAILPLLRDRMKANEIRSGNAWSARLMFLAKSTDDEGISMAPELYMIVLCPSRHLKFFPNFFDKENIVSELLNPPDREHLCFKYFCEGSSPRMRSLLATVGVEIKRNQQPMAPDEEYTFCGRQLRLMNPELEAKVATFGGVLKVVDIDDEVNFYGMTAGHGIFDPADEEYDTSSYVDSLGASGTANADGNARNESLGSGLPDEIFIENKLAELSVHGEEGGNDWQLLGTAFTKQDRSEGYSDWALIKMDEDQYLPNMILQQDHPGTTRKRPLSTTVGKMCPDSLRVGVEMIGGPAGSYSGELSTGPARIMLGTGGSPLKAYIMTLEADSGMLSAFRLNVCERIADESQFLTAIPDPGSLTQDHLLFMDMSSLMTYSAIYTFFQWIKH